MNNQTMNPPGVIRVSLVEDNQKIRESLEVLINGCQGFCCVSVHESAEDACAKIPLKKPDVALVDINLPNISGIECVRQLRTAMPSLRIIMHTVYENREKIFTSLQAGANGYLLKRTPPAKLLEALGEVHQGHAPMSGEIAAMVVEFFHRCGSSETEQLTEREREVLVLLSQGYRNKEISDMLGVGFDTVRAHLRNTYHKLHVNSRTEAVLKFLNK